MAIKMITFMCILIVLFHQVDIATRNEGTVPNGHYVQWTLVKKISREKWNSLLVETHILNDANQAYGAAMADVVLSGA